MNKEKIMKTALEEAKKAFKKGEVPVGAVITKNNKIISKGYNLKENKNKAIMHAEIIAITKANKKLKSWRLDDCELYVTLEPCMMCAGAIIQSRIKKVYYGLPSSKFGIDKETTKYKNNHQFEMEGNILEGEISALLKKFFKEKRK